MAYMGSALNRSRVAPVPALFASAIVSKTPELVSRPKLLHAIVSKTPELVSRSKLLHHIHPQPQQQRQVCIKNDLWKQVWSENN